MRAVVQRVSRAQVQVAGGIVGRIERGLCVLVGVGRDDESADAQALADKVVNLRIFEDEAGKMNLALPAKGGALLAISQFTLFGDVRKGRRPSFGEAMEPRTAAELFEEFCAACRKLGVEVQTGRFRAEMAVELVNDGPVTILVDSVLTRRAARLAGFCVCGVPAHGAWPSGRSGGKPRLFGQFVLTRVSSSIENLPRTRPKRWFQLGLLTQASRSNLQLWEAWRRFELG